MKFSDFLKIVQLLPSGFLNDFIITFNNKELFNCEIDFQNQTINFTE